MTIDRYNYFLDKTKNDFNDLIVDTQNKLNLSQSKENDYKILYQFWNRFMKKAINKWCDSSILFLDNEAITPMIESVQKQFCDMLFNIKHLDLLNDLGIYEGF